MIAVLFAGLAVLGALVGLEDVDYPMGGQSPVTYGWTLCINGAVIAAFLVYSRFQKHHQSGL